MSSVFAAPVLLLTSFYARSRNLSKSDGFRDLARFAGGSTFGVSTVIESFLCEALMEGGAELFCPMRIILL